MRFRLFGDDDAAAAAAAMLKPSFAVRRFFAARFDMNDLQDLRYSTVVLPLPYVLYLILVRNCLVLS